MISKISQTISNSTNITNQKDDRFSSDENLSSFFNVYV